MKTLIGNQLHPSDQAHVLRAYVHRFTGDNFPKWAKKGYKGGAYPLQFANDAEWLANTRFRVRSDGRLDQRSNHCESSPTWPHNPELRKVAA